LSLTVVKVPAVYDAAGGRVKDMPLTPEKVWRVIKR
jgi:CO/xanthine dehydrogenase Mo-binding subunit